MDSKAKEFNMRNYDKKLSLKIQLFDKMNDLAILKANLTPSKVYSVSTEDASLLEDIIIAGYPLGKRVSAAIKTSKGSITALAGYGDNYSEFQTFLQMIDDRFFLILQLVDKPKKFDFLP